MCWLCMCDWVLRISFVLVVNLELIFEQAQKKQIWYIIFPANYKH